VARGGPTEKLDIRWKGGKVGIKEGRKDCRLGEMQKESRTPRPEIGKKGNEGKTTVVEPRVGAKSEGGKSRKTKTSSKRAQGEKLSKIED